MCLDRRIGQQVACCHAGRWWAAALGAIPVLPTKYSAWLQGGMRDWELRTRWWWCEGGGMDGRSLLAWQWPEGCM